MDSYKRVMDSISRVVLILTGAMMSAMVLIIFVQVFGRFVFNHTPRWSEESALVLMLYVGFLGATVVYRERMHIGIKFIVDAFTESVRRRIYFVIDILIGVLGAFMVIWGAGLSWRFLGQTLPATKLPVGVAYMQIPIAGLILLSFVVEKLINDLTGGPIAGDDDALVGTGVPRSEHPTEEV
jgi:TRAP-type C4-dicarboxylate transport system permease small subunit